ncbi:hypothetical protein DVH24_042122 [Malus domestica]|uniref:Uncharacterized protein n=1 Tax=Malus domestica TaxID=3750 RepID=A0A498IT41_MALDO|nr:hypothetical protein DVH24_042122 [Malus domestica]
MTLPCGVLGLYPMEVMYTTMGFRLKSVIYHFRGNGEFPRPV